MSTLESKLEALPAGWSIWQTAMGGYCVQLVRDNQRETLSGQTLAEAVDKASTYTWPTRLVRRPEPFCAADWVPYADGRKWRAMHKYDGRDCGFEVSAKGKVIEALQRFEDRTLQLRETWDAGFAKLFPNGGVEGVDYVFE